MRTLKRILRSAGCLLCLCAAWPLMAQPEGMQIQYLGANHVLLKVESPKRYVLLPVEEKAPEAPKPQEEEKEKELTE